MNLQRIVLKKTKGHIVYDSTYTKFINSQNYITKEQISGCQGLKKSGAEGN